MANHAHVTAKWTASVAPDIKSQHVKVTVGDAAPVEADLTPDVLTYEFDAPEKTHVEIVVTAFDGVLSSDPVTATLDVPALTPPAPVTDLTMTFETVADAPPAPPVA